MNRWFPQEPSSSSRVIAPLAPVTPTPAARVPVARVPVARRAEPFAWVAAHGGAGATSLQVAAGCGLDLGGRWPALSAGDPSTVVLVCRSNTAGLDSAGRMLHQWSTSVVPGLHVLAVVVVADAPTKTSRAIRDRIGDLKAVVADVFTMPWISPWRDTPYTANEEATAIGDRLAQLASTQETR